MALPQGGSIIRDLRWLLSAQQNAAYSDGELLERYVRQQDESAFTALVRRHGRLVLGVGKRVLSNPHDAEDVFQAVFIILARKADTIRHRQAVGSWLYQTAFRMANKLRRRKLKLRTLPIDTSRLQQRNSLDETSWREIRHVLDKELARLSDKLRAPLVLCYLEGLTHDEAARQLRIPLCTLRARLARGRDLLRGRLTRRGLPFGSVLFATALFNEYSLAQVPPHIAQCVCHAVQLCAAGKPVAEAATPSIAALVQGVFREMAVVKIVKCLLTVMIVLGLASIGMGVVRGLPGETAEPGKIASAVAPETRRSNFPAFTDLASLEQNLDDPLPKGALFRLGTPRLRHGGAPKAVAWSPDSRWIVSASGGLDPAVRIWEVATGKEIRTFNQHQAAAVSAAVSPDGVLVASVDKANMLFFWEAPTGKVRNTRRIGNNATVTFAADGKRFATIDENGQACLVDSATLQTLRVFDANVGPKTTKAHVALSSDEKTVVASDTANNILIVDTQSGNLRRSIGHPGLIECLALSPDGTILATAGQDHSTRLWDAATGKLMRQLVGHQAAVKSVAWSPDGKTLATASPDKTTRLWDAATGKETKRLDHPHAAAGVQSNFQGVAISPDGNMVASIGHDGDNTIHIWSTLTGKESVSFDDHLGYIVGMALIDNGRTLLTSAADDTIRLWDPATGKRQGQFVALRTRPATIAVAQAARLLAVGTKDGKIQLLELPRGNLTQQIQVDDSPVATLAVSSDARLLGLQQYQ
jgi:RNA polymerase sigma factor (sigma-70 family)